ncbi:hypothetical protein L6164_029900 [Bauhinia variegata]|uniref:Uncharacterized protein n=1 Tax=Bauhinia variegata TaxID=167791 RepID=A0ACB9LAM8_BAUVA|nr:hypothetical protein L6164_029900 [Bauhinia variegata]
MLRRNARPSSTCSFSWSWNPTYCSVSNAAAPEIDEGKSRDHLFDSIRDLCSSDQIQTFQEMHTDTQVCSALSILHAHGLDETKRRNLFLKSVRDQCRSGQLKNVDNALPLFHSMLKLNPLPSSWDFVLLLGVICEDEGL